MELIKNKYNNLIISDLYIVSSCLFRFTSGFMLLIISILACVNRVGSATRYRVDYAARLKRINLLIINYIQVLVQRYRHGKCKHNVLIISVLYIF